MSAGTQEGTNTLEAIALEHANVGKLDKRETA